MKMRTLALCLMATGSCRALEPDVQKLADRYLAILQTHPEQEAARERLWKIYQDAGEAGALRELARRQAPVHPVLAASLLQRLGDAGEARQILREAAGRGDPAAAEMLAARLAAEDHLPAAVEVLEKAAASAPSPEIFTLLGTYQHKAGDPRKARAAWEQAVAWDPKNLGLRRRLAVAAAAAGDGEGAVSHWKVIAGQGRPAERFEAWQEIGRIREKAGDFSEALKAQEALLALMGPGHWQLPAARRRLLDLHRRAGTLGERERTLEDAAAAHPAEGEPALRLAEFYGFVGDDSRRLFWLEKAAALRPEDQGIAAETAALELASGQPAKAAARFDSLLAARPGDEALLFQRAEVAALVGDEAGAEERVEKFLAAHPHDETAGERVREFYRRLRLTVPLERHLTARVAGAPGDEAAAVELARFYLGENRTTDALGVLERFSLSVGDPKSRAAVGLRFSQLLKEARLMDEAVDWARKSCAADPGQPDSALHLADLLMAREDLTGAQEALERVLAVQPGLPREDLDRRLLLITQTRARNSEPGSPDSDATEKISRQLRDAAQTFGAEPAPWLRLARWLRWNAQPTEAGATLREAVQKFPQFPDFREMLAEALGEAGDPSGAIAAWHELATLRPERMQECQRRIGLLEMDRGNADAGLKIFADLAADHPGEWQALADLAQAEQRAGNGFRAVETWEKAYGCAPSAARPGIRQPYLGATARLQLHERALDFFEAALVSEKETAAREGLLREAATYAVQNHLEDDWLARIERHASATPDQPGWALARIFLLEAEGRKADARAALVASQGEIAESPATLEPLVKAAEAAEDWTEAARLTRRMMALTRRPDAALALRLCRFLEQSGNEDSARAAWIAATTLHARDPVVLTAAAEFFDRIGEESRMEAALRGASKFGACAPQVLLRLGLLALERGDRAQALADFDEVMLRIRPESGKILLPLPDRLLDSPLPSAPPAAALRHSRPSVSWVVPDPQEDSGCRLLAIRHAARLLANSPSKAHWLAQFQNPVEKVWAAYFAGEQSAAFDGIEKLDLSKEERESAWPAFAALLIEAGDGRRLTRQAAQDPLLFNARWAGVVAAVQRLLDAGWRPTAPEVFFGSPAVTRWQIADLLAARNLYREAIALGGTVPDDLPVSLGEDSAPAGGAWLQLARWHLALRDPDGAVTALDHAIARAPVSRSFASPLLAAIRARWLLTPAGQRANFENTIRASFKESPDPALLPAVNALLAALAGDPSRAADYVSQISSISEGRNATEGMDAIQKIGRQLEEWNLPRLARDVYREERKQDRALRAMQHRDDSALVEMLLITNQLTFASPTDLPYLLAEWLARTPGNSELITLARHLKQSGHSATAAEVLTALGKRNPREEFVKAALWEFVEDPLTRRPASALVEKFLQDPPGTPGEPLVRNAALRLAVLSEQGGEFTRCLDWLDRLEGGNAVQQRQIVQQRVRVLCALGRHREALAEIESRPALLLPGSGLAGPLAQLYAGFGRADEAQAVLAKEAGGTARSRISSVQKTKTPPGREEDPRTKRFLAGRKRLETQRDLPEAERAAELTRLGNLVARNPALRGEFFRLRRTLAESHGTLPAFEKELTDEWDSGNGPREAGETLVLLSLESRNFPLLARILDALLTDIHFNEPFWDSLSQLLLKADEPALAARVLEALIARAPGSPARALFFAEALWKSGRPDEARDIVAPLERMAAVDWALGADLARFALAIGDPEAARNHLLAARPFDLRVATLWAATASAFLARDQVNDAGEAISRALWIPSSLTGAQLADYQAARGDLAVVRPGATPFPLPPFLSRDFCLEMASRLAAAGSSAQAWLWLESAERPLALPAGRSVLKILESADPVRAAALWEAAIDRDATWEMRQEAAQFHFRTAQAETQPARRLSNLIRAHELDPGSFAIADACAQEFVRVGKETRASELYRNVEAAFTSDANRTQASEKLTGHSLSQ